MKKLKLIPLFLFGILGLYAQNNIDIQQDRIDMLDGVKDQNVAFSSFNYLYFTQIDLLQEKLLESDYQEVFKKNLELAIYHNLYSIDEDFLRTQRKGPGYFMTLEEYLNKRIQGKGALFLATNLPKAYDILPFIGEDSEARSFLQKEALIHPENVLQHYPTLTSISYAKEILSKAVQNDPIQAKQYFNDSHPIHLNLKASTDTLDQLILNIYESSYKPSWGLSLFDAVAKGQMSIGQADRLANLEDELYLRHLVNLVSAPNVLGKRSIDNLLHTICTRKVREINGQYQESNENIRFESIEKYESHELYNFIVYSQEEIFTSSFNGIFKMLLDKKESEGINSFELLQRVNFNEFRTFIKMCASYASLESFLEDISLRNKAKLFHEFIALDTQDDYLKEAVSIADAIGSLQDSTSIYIIERELYHQYQNTNEHELRIIYALLIKLFVDKSVLYPTEFKAIAALYPSQTLSTMSALKLFGYDETHTQVHLFYQGKDGESSYASFMSLWRNSKWQITDLGSFVIITSTSGKKVQIAANKPKHDIYGPQEIINYFRDQNADIEVLVHRGHSFYVSESLEYLQADMQIVLLGSCGGYNQVLNILNQSPMAQIISTKQIGSYSVNNPLVYQLASQVNEGKNLNWESFWDELATSFTKGSYAHKKFEEYIPPHKNLGATFIQAYREIVN